MQKLAKTAKMQKRKNKNGKNAKTSFKIQESSEISKIQGCHIAKMFHRWQDRIKLQPAKTLGSIFALSTLNLEKAKTFQRLQKCSDSSSKGQP